MIENSHISALEARGDTIIDKAVLQTDPRATLREDSPLGEDSSVGLSQAYYEEIVSFLRKRYWEILLSTID